MSALEKLIESTQNNILAGDSASVETNACELIEVAIQQAKRIKELEASEKRLLNTFEDKSLEADSHLTASDAYYEIAEILGVPENGSVIDYANFAAKKMQELEAYKLSTPPKEVTTNEETNQDTPSQAQSQN